MDPSDKDAFSGVIQRSHVARSTMVAGFQGAQGQLALIDLEPSCGRLGASDLKAINKELRALIIRATYVRSCLSLMLELSAIQEAYRRSTMP